MPTAAQILLPPLREGDRMTSAEFMRRWEAMPDLKKAELIDGVVYMPSPVGLPHGDLQAALSGWLSYYSAQTPRCRAGMESTWLMGDKDVPQPDITLRILPEQGGQSRTEGVYAAGAPELVIEVAMSSRARDLGRKLKLYERMGVREYLVAMTDQKQLLWHEQVKGRYRVMEPDADGVIRSRCFPGLWLDTAALWRLDQAGLFAALQKGLAGRSAD